MLLNWARTQNCTLPSPIAYCSSLYCTTALPTHLGTLHSIVLTCTALCHTDPLRWHRAAFGGSYTKGSSVLFTGSTSSSSAFFGSPSFQHSLHYREYVCRCVYRITERCLLTEAFVWVHSIFSILFPSHRQRIVFSPDIASTFVAALFSLKILLYWERSSALFIASAFPTP